VAGQVRRLAAPGQASSRRERAYAYLTLLPALLVVAGFTVYPLVYSVYLSLHREILTDPLNHPFTGLTNYAQVLGSYYLVSSTLSTIIFAVLAVPAVLVFGLAVALLLNQSFAGSAFLRVVILLPWAMPAVISGIVWRWIFNGDYGVLNTLLSSLGIIHQYIPWLSTPATARAGLVVAQVWREGPLAAIFFLAALQTIPRELYSAAKVDGGGQWSAFRHVTLPMLRPTLSVVLIYETIVAVVTFDLVYVMTGGGPGDATSLISWYAYSEVFKFVNLGHGAALAFLIAAALVVVILVYLRALRSEELY
jgi:ABC-type sugar transport system permease subunit